MGFRQQLRLGLAKAHGLAARTLHLAHDEDPDPENDQHREPVDQRCEDVVSFRRRLRVDQHALGTEQIHILPGTFRRVGLECAAAAVMTGDLLLLDGDVLNVPLFRLIQELGKGDFIRCRPLPGALKQLEQGDQQECDNHPECEIAKMCVHFDPFTAARKNLRGVSTHLSR